jgi:hypothetical protein
VALPPARGKSPKYKGGRKAARHRPAPLHCAIARIIHD